MQTIKYLDDGTVLGDPCKVFRLSVFNEFLETIKDLPYTVEEWMPIKFRGVVLQLYRTGSDAMYFGVPIDTGMVIKFALKDLTILEPPTAGTPPSR